MRKHSAEVATPLPLPNEGFHVCRARVDNVKHEAGSGRRTADSGWRHQQRSMDIINLDPFPHLSIFFSPGFVWSPPATGRQFVAVCWRFVLVTFLRQRYFCVQPEINQVLVTQCARFLIKAASSIKANFAEHFFRALYFAVP